MLTMLLASFVDAEESGEKSRNLTEQVAHEVVALDYANFPPEVVTKAEELIRDSLACAVGAHSSEALLKWEEIIAPDGGDCTIFHSGKKGKLLEAVALNSQAANMLDFDDAHPGIGHPGATIVPVD